MTQSKDVSKDNQVMTRALAINQFNWRSHVLAYITLLLSIHLTWRFLVRLLPFPSHHSCDFEPELPQPMHKLYVSLKGNVHVVILIQQLWMQLKNESVYKLHKCHSWSASCHFHLITLIINLSQYTKCMSSWQVMSTLLISWGNHGFPCLQNQSMKVFIKFMPHPQKSKTLKMEIFGVLAKAAVQQSWCQMPQWPITQLL